MESKDTNNPHTLKDSLMQRIDTEKLTPRSRLFFRGRECFIWTLWLLSVLIGALAVGISLFVMNRRQYELYEATHSNFFTFLVDILPFVWIIVFGIMTFLAVYNLRNTKKGYRYSVPTILASSIVLSFAGGSALQYFGLGYSIDSVLGQQMNMYMSQDKIEVALWQAPAEGRLIGQRINVAFMGTSTLLFEDSNGVEWLVETHELFPSDQALLVTNKTVRVLGKVLDPNAKRFHACGVFPWMMSAEVTRKELSNQRDTFVASAKKMVEEAQLEIALLEESTFSEASTDNTPSMKVCADIAAIRRVTQTIE